MKRLLPITGAALALSLAACSDPSQAYTPVDELPSAQTPAAERTEPGALPADDAMPAPAPVVDPALPPPVDPSLPPVDPATPPMNPTVPPIDETQQPPPPVDSPMANEPPTD
ncbi:MULTISPECIES: hypothetical protein [unclassified Luteimonas]